MKLHKWDLRTNFFVRTIGERGPLCLRVFYIMIPELTGVNREKHSLKVNHCKVGVFMGRAICDASNPTKKEGKREAKSVF